MIAVERHYKVKLILCVKNKLVFIISFIWLFNLHGQNNFEWDHVIQGNRLSQYQIGLEKEDGIFLFSSSQLNGVNRIELISNNGEIIKELTYSVSGMEIQFLKGMWMKDKEQLLLVGSAPPNLFAVLVLDKNLNIVFEKQKILTGHAKHPYQMHGFIYEPTNQVLLVAPSWDGIIDDDEYSSIWFLKLDLDSYELKSQLIQLDETGGSGVCYSVIENIDASGFICFGLYMHYLDKNFNHIGYNLMPENEITGGNQVKAIPWKDSTYLIGSTGQFGGVNLQVMDKNYKRKLSFGIDQLYRVAFPFNVFDLNDEGILYTGAYDTPFYHQSDGLFITKFDTGFQKNWEIYFGLNDQYRYKGSGIIATSDGGALVYGARYDDLGERVFNAYMVKFNSDGNISWTNNIDASQLITIKTYPNPSNGPLSFDIKGITGKADIRIFDMSGNNVYVHHGITDGATTLDLSDLVSGTYIYKVYQKNKVLGTGQWVKVE